MLIRAVTEPPAGAPLDSPATTARTGRVMLAFGADPLPGEELDATSQLDLVEWMGIRLRRALGESAKVILADELPVAVVMVDGCEADALARILARRLLSILREPYHLPQAGTARIRPSVGVSCAAAGSDETLRGLLDRARGALGAARAARVEPIAFA